MASPAQQIVQTVQLGSSPVLLFTSPSATWTQILALTANNTGSTVRLVTFYIVPAGAVAGTATATTTGRALLGGNTYNGQNEVGQILNPGDALWGNSDSGGQVNVAVSGLLNVS